MIPSVSLYDAPLVNIGAKYDGSTACVPQLYQSSVITCTWSPGVVPRTSLCRSPSRWRQLAEHQAVYNTLWRSSSSLRRSASHRFCRVAPWRRTETKAKRWWAQSQPCWTCSSLSTRDDLNEIIAACKPSTDKNSGNNIAAMARSFARQYFAYSYRCAASVACERASLRSSCWRSEELDRLARYLLNLTYQFKNDEKHQQQ